MLKYFAADLVGRCASSKVSAIAWVSSGCALISMKVW
ncbi:Uncharacterised protein [Mycobacterium tuberculosis]|nr:Uncharacterised protein [Mycobacterium tuberculosis]CKP47196.1 Uncharacterised protein [Mycobacterium tuberculosis]CKR05489.1 Uncharacterised protein [Mycobacterium tuberculosis]CKR08473.1 Uncharacterised protein [Mycobacterium tuberculosis]CKR16908.1 Uncharacterised protein [Mycobacterium tuberculosis]